MTTSETDTAPRTGSHPLPPGTWTVDAAHTLVEFSVRHMTVARVAGRFPIVDGTVRVHADERPDTVEVHLDVTTVKSGNAKRDELVRSEEFLDVEHFPVVTFVADSITTAAEGHWDVAGELTVKGATRPVVLDATFGGIISHRGATRAGFTARAEVDRKDFGLSFNGVLDSGGAIVSDTVRIDLEVELVLTEG